MLKIMKQILFLLFVVTNLTACFAGESYRVTTKQEFDEAVLKVQPGDEIILANGEWRDVQLALNVSGTPDQMIYLRGEQGDKVFISGRSQILFGGDYLSVSDLSFNGCVATSTNSKGRIVEFRSGRREANHCVISDCHFDSCVPENKAYDDVWINLYGTYNTVERCYMGGKDNKGLYIVVWHKNAKADYHTIRQNYFYRPKTYNREENGQEIIRIGDSSNSLTNSSTVVEDNFFYRCNGEIEIISIKSGDNHIRRNTFLECAGCVTLRHGNYNTISDNYFIANNTPRAGGVRVINKGHKIYNNYFYGQVTANERAAISLQLGVENGKLNEYDPVKDVEIYNNTMVNCKENFSFGVGRATLVPSNVLIEGNLVVSTQSSTLIDDNNTDTQGIRFANTHLENSNEVSRGEGLIKADYTLSTMTIAGVELPKIISSTTYIAEDNKSKKIGADLSTPVATNLNCGPSWSGWARPY